MDDLKIIDEHIVIREIIGYSMLDKIDVVDMPEFIRFLKIVFNYKKMSEINER